MFMLITVTNRDIASQRYISREAAWAAMLSELLTTNDNEFAEEYDELKDKNDFIFNADDFGIDRGTAWCNACNGMMRDWAIFDLSEK